MATGTIIGNKDYFESATASFSASPSADTQWSATLHVPSGYTIVSISIQNNNSSTVVWGYESFSRTNINGYGRRVAGTATVTVNLSILVHAIKTTCLTIHS